jgi:SAM-dependent methyltransferase
VVAAPPRFRAVHERVLTPYELALLQRRRRQLLAHGRGTVVDLGGGSGGHLGWYPSTVERVVVVGPDPFTRGALERRAAQCRVPVTLAESPEAAGLGDGSADTVVSQLVLCAVDDLADLLASVRRLLAPEGRLLFLEHVPPRGEPGLARALARPLWRQVAAGCDLTLDLPAAVRRAGFTIVNLERFSVPTLTVPLRWCAFGVARPSRERPS